MALKKIPFWRAAHAWDTDGTDPCLLNKKKPYAGNSSVNASNHLQAIIATRYFSGLFLSSNIFLLVSVESDSGGGSGKQEVPD